MGGGTGNRHGSVFYLMTGAIHRLPRGLFSVLALLALVFERRVHGGFCFFPGGDFDSDESLCFGDLSFQILSGDRRLMVMSPG